MVKVKSILFCKTLADQPILNEYHNEINREMHTMGCSSLIC